MRHRYLLVLALLISNAALSLRAVAAEERATYSVGYRILDLDYVQNQKHDVLTVAVWYPTLSPTSTFSYGGPTKGDVAVDGTPAAGRFPLLLFAHGYGGGGLAAQFFAEALAAQGWIVAAPDHHDKDTAVRIHGGRPITFNGRRMLEDVVEITKSGPTTRDKYFYRLDEFKAALNGVMQSPHFRRSVDDSRIAVGGHSLGGFTALGLCGTLPDRFDRRIKAAVILSSAVSGYLYTEAERKRVRMPVMLMFGERESTQRRGGRRMADVESDMFESFAPPKYFLEIKGGTHFSFNNTFNDTFLGRSFSGKTAEFEVIVRYGTAFLQSYVAGKPDLERVLEASDPRLSRFSRVKP